MYKPGRSLDALISTKVMGGYVMDYNNYGNLEVSFADDERGLAVWEALPEYSTDIAAAWTVVEKLRISGIHMFMDNTRAYRVHATNGWKVDVTVDAETAPHAICLAALKAVGYELKETK